MMNLQGRVLGNQGLTLVELMVAMLLLVIFLVPALSGFMLAESETQRSHDATVATGAAARVMEDIKDFATIDFFSSRLGGQEPSTQPYDIDLSKFPVSNEPAGSRFVVRATVKVWATTPSSVVMQDVKEVTVKVFRAGQENGTPLAEITQWITLGGP